VHPKKLLGVYNRERSNNELVKLSKRNLSLLTGFAQDTESFERLPKADTPVGNHGDCRFCGDEEETPELQSSYS